MIKLKAKQLAAALFEATEGKTGAELQKITAEFVKYLAAKQSLGRWREIERSFERLWQEKYGISEIEVQSAYPITEKIRKQIEKFAPNASLIEKVDLSLIGGLSIRINDRILDATIKKQLESFALSLK